MNETTGENLFDYINSSPEIEEIDMDESDKPPFMEGICPKCLDTGYKHTVKDGVLGLAYQFSGEDSTGQRIKRLLVCGCALKSVTY